MSFWAGVLGLLSRWDLRIVFVDHVESAFDGTQGAMEVVFTGGPYLSAKIRMRRAAFDELSHLERERLIIHELLHILYRPVNSELTRSLGPGTSEIERRLAWVEEEILDNLAQALLSARYGTDAAAPRFAKEPKHGAS